MSFRDLINLGEKIIADATSGAYASTADDIGTGFHMIGDMMRSIFGFRATPDEPTTAEAITFVAKGRAVCKRPRGGATASFDPSKWVAAFEMFLDDFAKLWSLFHPTPTP